MKRVLLIFSLISTLYASSAWAQYRDVPNGISYNITFFDYYSPVVDEWFSPDDMTVGAKLGYHRNLVGPLNLEVPIKIGSVRLPTPDREFQLVANKKWLTNVDAILQLQWFKPNHILVPYLTAGVGGTYIEDEDFDIQFPVGVGLDLRVFENFYLMGRSEYRFASNDYRNTNIKQNNITHMTGIKILFGGTQREPEPPAPKDTDGDGVLDVDDNCPGIAGKPELAGCPDTDGDGIADKDDSCPDVAGLSQFNGCPDTDGDGVPDNDDNCPNEAGPASNNGCPLADSDNDGIPDIEDLCPNQPGSAAHQGCPDTDGDGIADKDDDCPNEAGLAINRGCPDSDGDGIIDSRDKCPNQPGTAANDGCPEVPQIEAEDKETLEVMARSIQFKVNSSYLEASSNAVLDQIAAILQKYPDYNVAIDGYTDSAGKDSYNQWLSERRAERVYNYFINKGVAASRMKFTGHGEANPIAPNDTEAGRDKNRRVEIKLTPK